MTDFHRRPTLFLEASVVIAALLSSTGGSFQICAESHHGHLRLRTNRYVVDEVADVLERKSLQSIISLHDLVAWSVLVIDKNPPLAMVRTCSKRIHPEDAPVLAGALRAKADFLVTLDQRDFFTEKLRTANLPLHIATPRLFFQEHWQEHRKE